MLGALTNMGTGTGAGVNTSMDTPCCDDSAVWAGDWSSPRAWDQGSP